MEQVILDPVTATQLQALQGSVEILNPAGRIIGVFHRKATQISPEERAILEERRKDRSGRPFRDVIDELRRLTRGD